MLVIPAFSPFPTIYPPQLFKPGIVWLRIDICPDELKYQSADPDIFLGGGPTENALVLLYDTLISGFQWM